MSQYLAVVELSSLDGNNGFQINGEAASDQSGHAVSSGDINGDGFADLIIGAWQADPNGNLSGAAYVVFGKASGFPAHVKLSHLDGANGFQINGEAASDQSGLSVSSAGDVNGDGFADVFVGAPQADPNGSASGASYVVFGKASGFGATLELSGLDGNNGFQINGEAAGNGSGASVSSAGDVNGDGIADLIVGAGGAGPNGARSGASYVVFGTDAGFGATLELSALDSNSGFQINGVAAYDYSGLSVSSVGDVNGDGFADLIVGAPYADPNGSYSGASYVVFGTDTGFAATLELSSLDGNNGFRIKGEAASDQSGVSVSSAGDVNADGFADMIVGARFADPNGTDSGASYVVFGKASGFHRNLDLSHLNGHNGFKINGEAASDYSGYSVSSAGDFNGDGFADLIVGADGADPNGSFSGASYVVFGKASGFDAALELSSLDGNNGFQINGAAGGDTASHVGKAGDVNGDGFDDLIVGADGAYTNGVYTGASYVIYGSMPGEAVARDGTAIANTIHGGNFDDTLRGRSGDDTLYGHGADDTIVGGHGNDTIHGGRGADTIGGGLGHDAIRGGNGADMLKGNKGADSLAGGYGNDLVHGSAGNDTLTGGSGDDRLGGGFGADVLSGGGGKDTFLYRFASHSTGDTYDRVLDFSAVRDSFDVSGAITGVDAWVSAGDLSTGTFDGDLAAAVGAGQLGADHAVLFTPNGGTLDGKTFLIVDQNGIAGYQTGGDLVIDITGATDLGSLDTGDFI